MKKSSDNHIRQILTSKFDNYESDRGIGLWQNIERDLETKAPGNTGIGWKKLFSIGVLALAIFLLGPVETANVKSEAGISSKENFSPKGNEKPDNLTELTQPPQGIKQLDQLKNTNPQLAEGMPPEATAAENFVSSTVEIRDEDHLSLENTNDKHPLPFLSNRKLVLENYTFSMPVVSAVENRVSRAASTKFHVSLMAGVTYNSVSTTPNPGDALLMHQVQGLPGISFKRLGFQPEVQFGIPLTERIEVNASVMADYRATDLEFTYQHFVDVAENQNLISEKVTIKNWSVGGSLGLGYALPGRIKKSLESRVEVLKHIGNMGNNLVGLYQLPINLRMAVPFYLQSGSIDWIVRPYGSINLNNRQTDQAITVSPLTAGVAVGISF